MRSTDVDNIDSALGATDAAPGIGAPDAPRVVAIVGTTGVGKTGLAVELALRFNGEVTNADSRYFYRGMDIGTAKPDMAERRGVPHHLVDVLDPADDMSLATYQDWAMAAIATTLTRGRLPLLVGGTPLYTNAVVEGWRIPRVAPDWELRAELGALAERDGVEALSARLAAVDPASGVKCGTNPRRIIRALEIWGKTGQRMSEIEGKGPRPFETLELGLTIPRDQLYARIDARVDMLVEQGLAEEVRLLLEGGLSPDAPSMSSIGYRQMVPYLRGEATLDACVQQVKFDTHRYVRHQDTWLRRNKRLVPVDVSEDGWLERTIELVRDFTEP